MIFWYVGFVVSLSSFFLSVTSLTSTRLHRFSISFPKTLLFISLKKSFSNEFFAFFRFSVLKSMYCLSQGDWLNFSTLRIFFIFKPRSKNSCKFDSATHTLSCLLTLGSVCLPNQLKLCIFRQSFCSNLRAYRSTP